MIQTYDDYKKGRTKVFFNVKNNEITSLVVGNKAISHESGFQFYVDDYVAEQLEKCELYIDGLTPRLKLKEDRLLIMPVENSEYKKRKKIEELERQLQKLKAD